VKDWILSSEKKKILLSRRSCVLWVRSTEWVTDLVCFSDNYKALICHWLWIKKWDMVDKIFLCSISASMAIIVQRLGWRWWFRRELGRHILKGFARNEIPSHSFYNWTHFNVHSNMDSLLLHCNTEHHISQQIFFNLWRRNGSNKSGVYFNSIVSCPLHSHIPCSIWLVFAVPQKRASLVKNFVSS